MFDEVKDVCFEDLPYFIKHLSLCVQNRSRSVRSATKQDGARYISAGIQLDSSAAILKCINIYLQASFLPLHCIYTYTCTPDRMLRTKHVVQRLTKLEPFHRTVRHANSYSTLNNCILYAHNKSYMYIQCRRI